MQMETVFWKTFTEACKARHTSPSAVAKALGLSSGSPTAWKRGTMPNAFTIAQIAQHLDWKMEKFYGTTEDVREIADGQNKNQPSDELEGLSPTAIQIAKLADRLPPEYLPAALALIESLERTIPNPGGGEQSQ